MAYQSYRDLIVWQKAMEMVVQVYAITKQFPKEELYGLTSQVRRAAVSIPSNIAEGHSRKSTPEFLNFLSIAQGSRAEVETQLMLAEHLGYAPKPRIEPTLSLLEEINRMISSLRNKLTDP
jgi:four helix bundle protein